MADKVIFQGGDDLDETNLAEATARSNQTDYVVRGFGFTADFNNDTLDIGSGFAIIETSNNEAFHVYPDKRSGLSLSASTTNHVFLEIDETTDDSISYHIDTANSAPSNPSLKIGTVDTSNDTTTEINREPDVAAATLDVTNASLVDAETDSANGSNNSGDWATPNYGTVNIDERGEFSSSQFTPDVTGRYHVTAVARCSSPSDQDLLQARIRNVTDDDTVKIYPANAASGTSSNSFMPISAIVKLKSGKSYAYQVRNVNSSYQIGGNAGHFMVRSVFRES